MAERLASGAVIKVYQVGNYFVRQTRRDGASSACVKRVRERENCEVRERLNVLKCELSSERHTFVMVLVALGAALGAAVFLATVLGAMVRSGEVGGGCWYGNAAGRSRD